MDSRPSSVGEVKSRLKAQKQVSYRMIVIQPPKSGWFLHTLLIDVPPAGLEAPYNTPFSYDYDDVRALAGHVTGEQAALWLREGQKVIQVTDPLNATRTYESIGTPTLSAPEAQGGAIWTHYPSRTQQSLPPMLWPHTQYRLSTQGSQGAGQFHRRLLIADGCPFFPQFEDLVGELIYGVARTSPSDPQFVNASTVSPSVTVRIAETKGWIDHIDVSPAEIRVAVKGDDLEGAHLQVSGGPTFHREVALPNNSSAGDAEARHLNVPLPVDPLPELWVVLSRGHSWLDYRVFPTQYLRQNGRGQKGACIVPFE